MSSFSTPPILHCLSLLSILPLIRPISFSYSDHFPLSVCQKYCERIYKPLLLIFYYFSYCIVAFFLSAFTSSLSLSLFFLLLSLAKIKSNAPFQHGWCFVLPPSSLTAFYLFVSVSGPCLAPYIATLAPLSIALSHSSFSIDQQQ